MAMNDLHDVFVDMLKDVYHAEKQLVRALPKMAKGASSSELSSAFEKHLEVTEGQVERIEDIFRELEMQPKTKVCHGMMGLVEEGKEVLEEAKDGNPSAIDAALIAAAQKVEHYEISAYGSLKAFAETLGLDRVAELLQESLTEEEEADEELSGLAEDSVNDAAAQAGEEEDEEEESQSASAGRSSRKR